MKFLSIILALIIQTPVITPPGGAGYSITLVGIAAFGMKPLQTVTVVKITPNTSNPAWNDYTFQLPVGWSCTPMLAIATPAFGYMCSQSVAAPVTPIPLPSNGVALGSACTSMDNAQGANNPTQLWVYCADVAIISAMVPAGAK